MTSFLAKLLSRCSIYTRSVSTYPRVRLSSLDKRDMVLPPTFRSLQPVFSVCSPRACICGHKIRSATPTTVNYVMRECYHNTQTCDNRRLSCPRSLLIWKGLNTVQNQMPFSVVPSLPVAAHSLAEVQDPSCLPLGKAAAVVCQLKLASRSGCKGYK